MNIKWARERQTQRGRIKQTRRWKEEERKKEGQLE